MYFGRHDLPLANLLRLLEQGSGKGTAYGRYEVNRWVHRCTPLIAVKIEQLHAEYLKKLNHSEHALLFFREFIEDYLKDEQNRAAWELYGYESLLWEAVPGGSVYQSLFEKVIDEVFSQELQAAHRSVNRVLSMKQRYMSVSKTALPLLNYAPHLSTFARLAGMAGLLKVLQGLGKTFPQLGLAHVTETLRHIFERVPPPPRPLKLIPKAIPNAPGFSA